MLITVKCKCGKSFRVDDSMVGETIHCMGCSKPVLVTRPGGSKTMPMPRSTASTAAIKPAPPPYIQAAAAPPAAALTTTPPPTPEDEAEAPLPPSSPRDYVYWIIVFAFFPLAYVLGQPEPPPFMDRVKQTIAGLPPGVQDEANRILDEMENPFEWDIEKLVDELFELFPGQKLEGAAYSRFTSIHWLFALVTVVVFAALLAACFSHGSVPVLHLVGIGLFTATIGIGILIVVHFTPVGFLIAVLEFSAEQDKSNFWPMLVFYTLGVGLVEEACKAMAILGYLKGRPQIGWRQACLCGLATGVGFGVSEGIMYSSQFYNGIADHMTYLVRFASCVSLHAIWSASAAVTLYHSQDLFHFMQEEGAQEEMRFERMTDELMEKFGSVLARYGMVILRMVVVVMILHGLYDAALSYDLKLVALLTALASFAWLAWQIEECRRQEAAGLVSAPAD